ncbi:MAG: preprotein translocase subunit SecA [Acidimicrobiia bacterium]
MSLLTKVMRAGEGRTLKDLSSLATAVNELESRFQELSDAELRAMTDQFRERLAAGEDIFDIEAEAFAVVREASKRVLGERHFDVQVIGAGALNRGMIAEMKTGEGKTLVATMPSYVNALGGQSVHIVTVNDYLASRDAEWMGGIHSFLGLTVGIIQAEMTPAERVPAYQADITYGTNNEFGFDYLRDNMAMSTDDLVQRGHDYAIVDEVDSILIDEARTPLIISGRVAETARWYRDFARIATRLREDIHYDVDEAKRQVVVTPDGIEQVEKVLGIENMYDHATTDLVHHLDVALRAKELYQRDVDYLIDHGNVKIVDEFTGRILEGRRYSEGLHQAIEAKEGVRIKEENQTLATITLQNFFRMYQKLAGMTGTAKTEAAEFSKIYGLEVAEIPTNEPVVRSDDEDVIYKTELGKFGAVTDDIAERHAAGQPVLVGTISIEKSELLSEMLKRRGIPHEVLNAKHHAREAQIIAQAGRIGAVTVATNMAGRGVDIILGGNADALAVAEVRREGLEPETPEHEKALSETLDRLRPETSSAQAKVIEVGGVYVLGTERHESRRIDNQLRGRSGRQGDPGESRFYLSAEDDLVRRFAGDRMTSIMERFKLPEDQPIEQKMVSKAIERAQTQVEAQNFELRKKVLEYDEVMNRQREVIYTWRNRILREGKAPELVQEWIGEAVHDEVMSALPEELRPGDWDWDELRRQLQQVYPTEIDADQFEGGLDAETVATAAVDEAYSMYEAREKDLTREVLGRLEQSVVLSVIDNKWREHLAEMDYLRAGIGLRAMGQRDPLVEYQNEGFQLFGDLVDSVKRDAVRYLFHVQVERQAEEVPKPSIQMAGPTGRRRPTGGAKVGRNEPCPCGSGKKYKRCHGAVA